MDIIVTSIAHSFCTLFTLPKHAVQRVPLEERVPLGAQNALEKYRALYLEVNTTVPYRVNLMKHSCFTARSKKSRKGVWKLQVPVVYVVRLRKELSRQ